MILLIRGSYLYPRWNKIGYIFCKEQVRIQIFKLLKPHIERTVCIFLRPFFMEVVPLNINCGLIFISMTVYLIVYYSTTLMPVSRGGGAKPSIPPPWIFGKRREICQILTPKNLEQSLWCTYVLVYSSRICETILKGLKCK
jgi:hypothetical protein